MLNHIAIIMDGNGRWAEARHLPRSVGHKKGAENVKEIIKTCMQHNVHYLTLYTFSSENWNRPEQEISDLMNLLRFYLDSELEELHRNGVKIKVLGDRQTLPRDICRKMEEAEKRTQHNAEIQVNIALSYGSRQEIVQATQAIAADVQSGKLALEDINDFVMGRYLYTARMPDPDLLIRTGGEVRLSNFLLWQSAYTELYFTDVLWPDFIGEDLEKAIADFHTRERRFGTTTQKDAVSQKEAV